MDDLHPEVRALLQLLNSELAPAMSQIIRGLQEDAAPAKFQRMRKDFESAKLAFQMSARKIEGRMQELRAHEAELESS